MASPTWGTWVWASSWSWWWTGKPGVLQSMGLQRVGHDWVNWTELKSKAKPHTEVKLPEHPPPSISWLPCWNFDDNTGHLGKDALCKNRGILTMLLGINLLPFASAGMASWEKGKWHSVLVYDLSCLILTKFWTLCVRTVSLLRFFCFKKDYHYYYSY